nr:MAG TPA: hypothetical protein [Caudoviricetes sp.]
MHENTLIFSVILYIDFRAYFCYHQNVILCAEVKSTNASKIQI